jgi:sporulation protein YlmC with PRC-barrel domain
MAEPVPGDHRFRLVSQLFGAPVENLAGVQIGTIDNLIIDAAAGRIVVALVISAPEHGVPAVHLELPWGGIINRGVDAPGVPYLVDLQAEEVRQQRAQLAADA